MVMTDSEIRRAQESAATQRRDDRRETELTSALESAKAAAPVVRAQLAEQYRDCAEILRREAAMLEAKAAYQAALDHYTALYNTARRHMDRESQTLLASGVAVLVPGHFDQVADPAELRQAAKVFDRLATAAK